MSGAWCPRCARGLSYGMRLDGFGSCPEHGRVQAWFTEPRLVVSDEHELERGARVVLGAYVRTDEDAVLYETAERDVRSAPEDCVSVVRWSDYEGEW